MWHTLGRCNLTINSEEVRKNFTNFNLSDDVDVYGLTHDLDDFHTNNKSHDCTNVNIIVFCSIQKKQFLQYLQSYKTNLYAIAMRRPTNWTS